MSGGGSNLAPKERAVMDRWDAGMSMERISEVTGLTLGHVRVIVARFAEANSNKLRVLAAQRGCDMLRDAIARMRGAEAFAQSKRG